jgi:hypothetical protein
MNFFTGSFMPIAIKFTSQPGIIIKLTEDDSGMPIFGLKPFTGVQGF